MAGMDFSAVNTNLVRTKLWSEQLKDVLKDMLQAQAYVNWMTNFPDGTTFAIPSIGEIPVRNVNELDPAVYDPLDTGEFNFTIDSYVEAGTYITDKAKQDSYYADQLIASFVPKMKRAIEENLETKILALANTQTAAPTPLTALLIGLSLLVAPILSCLCPTLRKLSSRLTRRMRLK
jgi:hypothetical protein